MALCIFGLPISLMMIEKISVLYLNIIIKSEVWPICHCLGLDHEKWYAMYVFLYCYALENRINHEEIFSWLTRELISGWIWMCGLQKSHVAREGWANDRHDARNVKNDISILWKMLTLCSQLEFERSNVIYWNLRVLTIITLPRVNWRMWNIQTHIETFVPCLQPRDVNWLSCN